MEEDSKLDLDPVVDLVFNMLAKHSFAVWYNQTYEDFLVGEEFAKNEFSIKGDIKELLINQFPQLTRT